MSGKRSGRFYRQNEREVMESLHVRPTKNSGSGWIEKEDGVGELTMVQLKSTDAMQITVKQKDIRTLERHAAESHKAPVFAIQFLNTGEVWLMARQEDLEDVAAEIGEGRHPPRGSAEISPTKADVEEKPPRTVVRSSAEGKEEFYKNAGNRRFKRT